MNLSYKQVVEEHLNYVSYNSKALRNVIHFFQCFPQNNKKNHPLIFRKDH